MTLQSISIFKGQYLKYIFLVVLFCIQSICLSAQVENEAVVITTQHNQQFRGYILEDLESEIVLVLNSTENVLTIEKSNIRSMNLVKDKFVFEDGRYHKKKGWVHSVGLNTGNLLIQFFPLYLKPPPTSMIDYKVYKLINPNVGIGVGVDQKSLSTPQLGYEYYGFYKFVDVFAYGKVYLGEKRRRLFLDAKLGYGFALENEIVFGCPYCDESLPLAQRYTSGGMLQYGGGIEFATKKKLRWGINWSILLNRTLLEEDEYPEDGRTPADGIIKFTSKKTTLGGGMLGISIYL